MVFHGSFAFDHVHLVARDPNATVSWYIEKLGGKILRNISMYGAPQISVMLGSAMIIVRGQRPAELAKEKPGLQWGVDHFGLQVAGDFDALCAELRSKGVVFNRMDAAFAPLSADEPRVTRRAAIIQAPDGVNVELLQRKESPVEFAHTNTA